MQHRSVTTLIAIAATTIATGYALTIAQEPRPRPEPVAVAASPSGTAVRSEVITTQQYRLKNIAVLDAARKINGFLAETKENLQVDGVVVRGSLVLVPIEVTNSLTVIASGKNHERLARLITELDAPPTEVAIKCSISRISADGTREVISRPTVRTLDGQQAIIQIGDGLEFSVTPTIRPQAEGAAPANRISP